MNWLHRLQRTGIKHYLRAEYGNWNLQFIRSRLADHIVYQSEFSRQWWERIYGPLPVSISIVHNAVDLETYSPLFPPRSPLHALPGSPRRRFLDGRLRVGLETAVKLVELLNTKDTYPFGKTCRIDGCWASFR